MVTNLKSYQNTKQQTFRSLKHKLEQNLAWRNATKDFYERNINACVDSWLHMSEKEKKKQLVNQNFNNFTQKWYNIIAKIEANLI